jgi:hypothetical protein
MKFLLIPFVFVLVAAADGCLAPVNVTVNVLSSRMIVSQASTNAIRQDIDGGASISSNATTVSAIPQ